MWFPDDGSLWTETCWSSFYNFNNFNNLRILQFVSCSRKIKCLILIHSATMKFVWNGYTSRVLHIPQHADCAALSEFQITFSSLYIYIFTNTITMHIMDSQCTSIVSLQKRKIILEQKCPFYTGTSQQHTDKHSLLRLINWIGQHSSIAIPEKSTFTISTVLLENLNVTQPVK